MIGRVRVTHILIGIAQGFDTLCISTFSCPEGDARELVAPVAAAATDLLKGGASGGPRMGGCRRASVVARVVLP